MLRYGERRNDSKCTLPSIATVKYSHNIRVSQYHITDTHSCQVFFLEKLFNLLKRVVLVQKCFLLFPIMLSIRLKLQSFPWIYHLNL